MKFLQSKEWKTLRQSALNRDCKQCLLCGSDQHLCVHHVLYRKFYKQHQLELKNLVTVCSKCHFKIHKGIGNILLTQFLMSNRKSQWNWIEDHI